MKIVGIDPSLTRTGVCVIDSAKKSTKAFSVVSKAIGKDASVYDRLERFEIIRSDIAHLPSSDGDADLWIIEGPSYGSNNAGTFERYGLWWTLVNTLAFYSAGMIAICPPTVRAKWATGKGNASKDTVMLAVDRVWPGVPSNNDEADAVAMATMGAQWFGWPVPTLERHLESIASVEWPTGERAEKLRMRGCEAVPGSVLPTLVRAAQPARKRVTKSLARKLPAVQSDSSEMLNSL